MKMQQLSSNGKNIKCSKNTTNVTRPEIIYIQQLVIRHVKQLHAAIV